MRSLENSEHFIKNQLVTSLLANLYVSILVNQLLGVLILIIIKDHRPAFDLMLWYAILTASTFARIYLSIKFKSLKRSKKIFIPKVYRIQLLISGSIWGFSTWMLYPAHYLAGEIILALMIMGLVATAAVALCLVWQDLLIYNAAILLPFIAKYIYEFNYLNVIIVFIVLIFNANIIFHLRKIHLRLKNFSLLENKLESLTATQLEEKHELLSFFENSSLHLLLLNTDGRILRANHTALIKVGLPIDVEVSQYFIWDSPWWRQNKESQYKIKSSLESALMGKIVSFEVEISAPLQHIGFHKIIITPIFKNNTIEFFILEGMDVSSLKSLQQKLLQTKHDYNLINQNVGEFVWEIDLNGYYQFASENSYSVKKKQPDELIGKKPVDFMIDLDADKFNYLLNIAFKSKTAFELDVRSRILDESFIWEKITAAPLFDENNEIIGYRGISTDITEQKNQHSLLIQSKELAEAGARAKSQFLATMSHEIRTPMNGVIGMAELLLESGLSKQQKQYANTIVSCGNSLLQILNNILDLSKIEAGKLQLEYVPFNLANEVIEVGQLIQASFIDKNINLKIDVHPDIPLMVLGDASRLRQILSNLLSNAFKFTSEGNILFALNLISQAENIATIEFKFKDSGIGISAENLTKIFDSFTQADTSTSRKFGGTGLGLSVTKELVDNMGGAISVTSKLNRGTTFTVILSFTLFTAETSSNSSQPLAVDVDFIPRNILLVEDNPVNKQVTLSMLEKIGHVVNIAGNGQEALSLCEIQTFDLILMDCQMPIIDGYEATLSIRATEGFNQNIPIIAMTANAMSGDREKCLAIGMTDYLAKPVNTQALRLCLEKYI